MKRSIFLMLLILVSCKTKETILSKIMPSNNILIYTTEKTVDFNFHDSKYKNEMATFIIKINKEEKTIQFASIAYKEDEKKELNKAKTDSLFLKNEKEYFTIKGNKLKTKVYKTKHKRAWNDFATPGSTKTGGDKYILKEDRIINQSNIEYNLNKKITMQYN